MDRKKLYKIIIITVVVILVIVGLCIAYYFIFGNKKSYSAIEDIMETAAEEYYDDHAEELPTEAGSTVIISVDTLVSGEYMDSIATLRKDESTSCSGEVRVMNNNGKYQYVASINCGDIYQTKNFKDYILENSKQVYDGSGIYEMDDPSAPLNADGTMAKKWVFKGENPMNYMEFSGATWRIVSFNEDSVELIYTSAIYNNEFDDRFNTDTNANDGINNYSVSRMREYLNQNYNKIVDEDYQEYVVPHTVCSGIRTFTDVSVDGSSECSTKITGELISSIPLYEYLRASLDANCTSLNSTCANYNYLSTLRNFWTITASDINSHTGFIIERGAIEYYELSYAYGIYPIIYITTNISNVSGTGASDDPFVINNA